MYSRLTTSTMYGSLMDSLMQSQRNLQELQKQIATGSKYTKLSDNPAAVARSLQIQSALNANDKYQTNTQNAVTMLRHSDSALNNVLDAAQAIRALIIQAGDGTLTADQLTDITAQIEANKKVMLDNLNTRIAGQYIFGGTDTSTRPFVEMPDGSIQYQGTDERIQYAVNDELLGDVSFAGSDIVPENEDSYFICSHYVPLDWVWTGREEKVQITVGNRTLSVFIPEDWKDSDYTKTNTDDANYSDTNGYRDPNEVTGISLTDLADIVNSALEEQGADMLVKAYIETDYEAGRQQLILKRNTVEKVGITGWPDTDYMPTEAAVTTLGFSDGALSFSDGDESKISIMTGNDPSTERKIAMKAERDSNDDLILTITRAYDPTMEDYDSSLPPYDDSDATTITLGNDGGTIDEAMYKTIMQALADKVNGINGIFARTTSDSDKIVITAERQGQLPSDRLHINEAEEALHYPSLTISAEGNATSIFPFEDGSTTLTAKSENRKLDHSHMDVFDVLGMETAMKSREFAQGETLTVTDQLHWRIMSGGKTADLKLNAGTYTLEDIATRLKNAGAGWVEVTLSEDVNDDWERGTLDAEAKTQRLVIRGYDGEQVLFLDMNEQNYADKLGLSTALRTDAYTSTRAGTGTKCVNFPSAPCVDDNVGIQLRVQMNCGMYYDVNIRKADVVNTSTGFVDRDLVMQEIAEQVNELEGHEIMGFAQHVDDSGADIDGSSAIYFLSGEAFTVVDLPFTDPEWSDYSGGLAMQMGIHGGVTSNLKQTAVPMKDNDTFGDTTDSNGNTIQGAYSKAGATFSEGTIRFSNLAHSVEIDVAATDTVKDVIDRLRTQAGDWLYVNYYDEHMGQQATRNTGDYPLIAISSADGSAVNVLDVKGHIAEDALGLSTGIQGRRVESEGAGIDSFVWDIDAQNFPADTMSITVAGYTHTIDLTALRDVTGDGAIKADDIVQFVNARMQDYDVSAEINQDGELMMWSKRGYSLKVEFQEKTAGTYPLDYVNFSASSVNIKIDGKNYTVDFSNIYDSDGRKNAIVAMFKDTGITAEVDESAGTITFKKSDGSTPTAEISYPTDETSDFLGNTSARSLYRGGYNLEGSAPTRGIDASNMYSTGIHAQNATIRSGANTMRQNGFGVINDAIAAIEAGNRDDLSDKMLPRIDDFISNILSVMAENGALQARYSYNTDRLVSENSIMLEEYDDVAKIDPADAITQLMVADYMYQANLAMIARIIQPSLLDFLH